MDKIFKWILKHKKAIIIFLILAAGGFYYKYRIAGSATGEIQYVLAKVEKGTLMTTVSGTGQVSATNQLEIKPKISADITEIEVKAGDKVKAGQVIAKLNSTDLRVQANQARISVDIARANLELKLAGLTADDIKLSKNSVDSAKIAYENSLKSLQNTKIETQQSLEKAELALKTSEQSLQNAQRQHESTMASGNITTNTNSQAITNAYLDARTSINSTLVLLRSSLLLADSMLGNNRPALIDNGYFGVLNSGTINQAQSSYLSAKESLNSFEKEYDTVSTDWDQAKTDKLLSDTLVTLNKMKELEHNVYSVLMNTISGSGLSQSALDGYRSSFSSQESSLISSINSINNTIKSITVAKTGLSSSNISTDSSADNSKASVDTAKNNLISAQNSLAQTRFDNKKAVDSAELDVRNKKLALENAQANHNIKLAPPRAVDIASLKSQIYQAQNTYQQASENLKNAEVRTPIEGVIAKVSANKGDAGSPSAAIATVNTQQKIAQIALNEVDAAKVKTGQKATITFNAIEDLSITGVVAEIDALGTVSQSVVTYNVKIAFDTQDQRVKSEMSVNVDIITEVKQDILLVPSTAVKSQNNSSYVEILEQAPDTTSAASNNIGVTSKTTPKQQVVVVGSSNDTNTEIIDGLKAGDQVVTQTIDPNSQTKTATQGQSGFRMMGGPGR